MHAHRRVVSDVAMWNDRVMEDEFDVTTWRQIKGKRVTVKAYTHTALTMFGAYGELMDVDTDEGVISLKSADGTEFQVPIPRECEIAFNLAGKKGRKK